LKRNTKTLFCILCAVLAAVCVIAACFFLVRKQSSSSASSTPSVSTYGKVEDFDYQNFDYSSGIDANGYLENVRALDYVTLPDNYTALPIKKSDITPSAEDIQAQVDNLLAQHATTQEVTGRAAQSGDIVNINYAGTVDGVAFTGGTYQGYDLTLGSGSFIDGFEDQIIGHNVGDTFDVNVTFPDGYDDSTDSEGNTIVLSGKAAVFSVTLNSISESVTPELTDAWVDANFGTSNDLHTAEAVRTYFSDALYDSNLENAIMDSLLDNSKFSELPTQATNYYICMFLNYYSQLCSYYSTDLNTFAQAQGYADADAMLAASDSTITHLAQQDLIYQAIAESQGITPSQENLDAASSNSSYGENFVTYSALQGTVLDWLKANAVIS
jgi:trigger factor